MSDPVKYPSHYTQGKSIQPVEVIADWQLDFFLGNALKYISRCSHEDSDTITDLQKARRYLEMKIELIEKRKLKESISE